MRLFYPFLASLLLLRAYSQTPTPTPTPFEVPEGAKNRYFSASTTSPLSTRSSRDAATRAHTLLAFMSFIDRAVSAATAASLDSTDPLTDVLTTCNDRDTDWQEGVTAYFGIRGWPAPDVSCVSNVYLTGNKDDVTIVGSDEPGFDRELVYDTVRARAKDLVDIAPVVAKDVGRDWPKATRATDFMYNIRTQRCTHDYAYFVRLGGKWFLASRLTNENKDLTLADGERQYIQEYVRAKEDGGIEESAKMRLREEVPGEVYTIEATTVIANLSGSVPASGFRKVFDSDNLAVQEALMAGEHETQQASDATTPSNIAILALPLAMNIVPVALVADVNSAGMLVYTLLTDVLTAVPLMIKGIEVLSIGLQKETAVVTRVTGAQLKGDMEKAGEVWVAQCVANGNLRPTGIALLVVAVVFMVGGVIAEFVARNYMRRKRRRKGELVVEDGFEKPYQEAQDVQAAGLVIAGTAIRGGVGATGPKME